MVVGTEIWAVMVVSVLIVAEELLVVGTVAVTVVVDLVHAG